MQNKKYYLLTLLSFSIFCFPAYSQDANKPHSDFYNKLKSLPSVVEVNETRNDARFFKESYEVTFEQPLDHQNPKGEKFHQRVFVSFADYNKPVLLETEGYAAWGSSGGELQRMLRGNQVTVEHRFFGKSAPSPLKWEYMTIRQSADDLHAVVAVLKTLYTGKWISSGVSKGGQTALFYKCFYPDDVNATVAYSAPVNIGQEDPRFYQFLQTVGDAATRKKLTDYQIAMFKRQDEILPLVKAQAEKRKWTFRMGLPAAYEYGILEYLFAFWQYGTNPAEIPEPNAPAEKLAAHYNRVGTLYYYSDQGQKQFEPFIYQSFTEMGNYNYDITDFKPYMKTLKEPTNLVLCPEGVKIVYNSATMAFVYNYLQYKADHIVYIYGGLDVWAATQIQLIGRTDSIKIVVPDGHHGAGVRDFSPEQKELFYSNMDKWLDMKLVRQ
jgi:pimeloyl-ACP methyl ester carboxylesterase